ncbi:hypothetical protein [Flavobacterium sp. HNIBRBA15423]|uniref:hypothetical protein n=1 Tax=Flavobacterium sp. HNIBRBA15423 TaxID=3458683 RepID=UPI004043EE45
MEKLDTKYIYFLTALYFIISLFGILHHELWLDESHHWLLARDSNSFLELIQNTRYEGHPILWNILLYGITRFTLNPFWMQFLHILISTTVVFVFLKKAPFNWTFKVLFIFGYFMLFEYNIISRNYILGVLFLFLVASYFKNREQNFILVCFYLILACNVHLLFSVISFGFFLIISLEQYQNKQLFKKQNVFGYLIFGVGFIFILIQIQTTNSSWLLNSFDNIPFHEKLIKGFIAFFKGLITIPDFRTIHFWNSNYLININKSISSILGLLVYFIPLLLFYKNKKTLYFVYITLVGVQIFFFITQRGATRFDGITYIIIIIALWIENDFNPKSNKLNLQFKTLKNIIIYSILSIHFFSGVYAYALEIKFPFSGAKEVTNYLKKEKLTTKKLITFSCEGTALSPYLSKKIFFLNNNSYESYCNWVVASKINFSKKELFKLLSNFKYHNETIIYISREDLKTNTEQNKWEIINNKFKIRLLIKFTNNILSNSNYYVYEVAKIESINSL